MTRRSIHEEKIEPTLAPERAIELIKRQIGQIDGLLQLNYNDPEVRKWDNMTEQILINAFGKPHDNLSDFYSVRHGGSMIIGDEYEAQQEYKNHIQGCRKLLEGFIEQLEIFAQPSSQQVATEEVISKQLSKRIFIVHGHDDQAKSELALILSRLELEPIILHEQANEGMTVIEKLEKHSGVGFAFVLLTPDDVGESVDNRNNLKPRARQNVVFEFGLFVGKLARSRVCCLHKGDVELPSDLNGIVYIPYKMSVNEIQVDIVRELREVGYEVNI